MKKLICRQFLALLVGIVSARVDAQPTPKIIEDAKKEGKFVFYTVLTLPDSQALLKGFQQKYPFIEPELFRLGAEKMRTKILTEARAGRHSFDVTSMDVVENGVLQTQRIFAPYKASTRDAVPAGLKDEEGYWTAIYVRQFVLAYNTRLVSEKDAPRDWAELLTPKWKGKLGMDQEETEWYAALSEYWGRDKARKFLRERVKQVSPPVPGRPYSWEKHSIDPYLPGMEWLIQHHCDCMAEVAEVEAAIRAYPEAADRNQTLAALAHIRLQPLGHGFQPFAPANAPGNLFDFLGAGLRTSITNVFHNRAAE